MNLFAVLWSLAWAIASVSAYDLYGGYERVMFYNAYRSESSGLFFIFIFKIVCMKTN
jgi:hypothetical protein